MFYVGHTLWMEKEDSFENIPDNENFTGCIHWNDKKSWWLKNGGFHREDGPAVVDSVNGYFTWYYEGNFYGHKHKKPKHFPSPLTKG